MVKTMDKNYLTHVAESKAVYHKKQAEMSYEEKVKIIVQLQKIKYEFNLSKQGSKRNSNKIWDITF